MFGDVERAESVGVYAIARVRSTPTPHAMVCTTPRSQATVRFLGAALLLDAAVRLRAQNAPAAPNPPAAPTAGEVVQLAPFQVSTDRDVGYVASSSLAGSRLNSPLRDSPASISVMTAEFLADIGAG